MRWIIRSLLAVGSELSAFIEEFAETFPPRFKELQNFRLIHEWVQWFCQFSSHLQHRGSAFPSSSKLTLFYLSFIVASTQHTFQKFHDVLSRLLGVQDHIALTHTTMGLRDRLLGRESNITSNPSSAKKTVEPPVPNASKPQITNRINAVYYPNWRIYRQQPPSSMNLRYITHIFYAFAW